MARINWYKIITLIFILISLTIPSQFKARTQEITSKRVIVLGKALTTDYVLKNYLKSDIEMIKYISNIYNVDYRLIYSVSAHETGYFKSYNYKVNNNPMGIMSKATGKIMKFSHISDGYMYGVWNIKNNYIDRGLDTIEKMQPKYAPLNASNDPHNLNYDWVSGVSKIYRRL